MPKNEQTAETPAAHALAVLGEADRLFTAAEVSVAYDRLASEIGARLNGSNPLVLCVMIGGMVPTVEILRRLEWPYELDYLHATRYQGETRGSSIVWKVSPSTRLEGRTVLIIDDILDEGHTLAAIQKAVRAQGVAALYTAVLAEKRHARRHPEARADFIGLTVPDRYVFGGGMDYRNFLRFAPGIYAVKGL
ncbi:MAG TPA: hypoxanthine-guanine phosphoribosyltransferase [Nevskiales bacterium]|nr:hypoxanthine-guanine phosphoribosyltransferase [Nevskiales bacterium]